MHYEIKLIGSEKSEIPWWKRTILKWLNISRHEVVYSVHLRFLHQDSVVVYYDPPIIFKDRYLLGFKFEPTVSPSDP